ncbi:hypothetical protein [Actinoplanes sp. NPDC049316]|uniref:hypothetical protein n=1 Tax=Actinoplanes sp. NPDC049316 TaxID=3154727 RepID=UPI003435F1A1
MAQRWGRRQGRVGLLWARLGAGCAPAGSVTRGVIGAGAALGEVAGDAARVQEAVEAAGDEVVDEEEEDDDDEVDVAAGVGDAVEDESDLPSVEVVEAAGLSALTLPERESLR